MGTRLFEVFTERIEIDPEGVCFGPVITDCERTECAEKVYDFAIFCNNLANSNVPP